MTNPPTPPDIHAIQSYFFDPDGKEWIATVLAPRGRELAAQWQGAYKVPDRPDTATSGPRKSSPAPLFAIVLVVLIVGGGAAAVVAGTQSTPNASPGAPTGAPEVSVVPTAPVAVSAEPTESVAATPAPTQRPGGTPVPTQPPVVRTPAPTAPPPPPPGGTSIRLADGSVVTYSGPSRVNIGSPFVVTFTVRDANNTPGSGTLLVSFGNQSTGGAKTSSGTLNPNGQFTVNYPGQSLPGNYPFIVNYKGVQGQVAIIRVG